MSEKLYAERNIVEQGDYYSRHTSAMTGEGLHSKSDIAAELAHRDIEIARLQSEVERLRGRCGEMEDECRNAQKYMVWLSGGKEVPTVRAWLLRNQAEAVENAAENLPDGDGIEIAYRDLHDYAQRLRQQADEVSDGT